MRNEPLISTPAFFTGLLTLWLILDFSAWLIRRNHKERPYQLITLLVFKAVGREIKSRWDALGQTTGRKLVTVAGMASWFSLKYIALQYLTALSGVLSLAYALFYWPVNITPLARGIVLGLSVMTHIVWISSKFGQWMEEENPRETFLFLWRMPWQLFGAVSFTMLIMSAIQISGDTGLIDSGMGYQLHPLSFIIQPLIMVGLYLGDSLGDTFNNIWLTLMGEDEDKPAAKPGGPVVVEA